MTFDGRASTSPGNGAADWERGSVLESTFNRPQALATDGMGNVFVTEIGGYRVRRLSPEGDVTTVAGADTGGYTDGEPMQAQFFGLEGLDVSSDGRCSSREEANSSLTRIDPGRANARGRDCTHPPARRDR